MTNYGTFKNLLSHIILVMAKITSLMVFASLQFIFYIPNIAWHVALFCMTLHALFCECTL